MIAGFASPADPSLSLPVSCSQYLISVSHSQSLAPSLSFLVCHFQSVIPSLSFSVGHFLSPPNPKLLIKIMFWAILKYHEDGMRCKCAYPLLGFATVCKPIISYSTSITAKMASPISLHPPQSQTTDKNKVFGAFLNVMKNAWNANLPTPSLCLLDLAEQIVGRKIG